MSKSDGGPAFPHVWVDDGRPAVIAAGMTLRDYFAAAVLQGLIERFSQMTVEQFTDANTKIAETLAKRKSKEAA